MIRKARNLLLILFITSCLGCSQTTEVAKVIWGSSTAALEEARRDGVRKSYNCSFDDCYAAVLSLARNEEDIKPVSGKKVYDVFIKDWVKSHIVVMGIKGHVNTTEVGIFLTKKSNTATEVEISSLSSSAKRRVADAVFTELGLRFYEVE